MWWILCDVWSWLISVQLFYMLLFQTFKCFIPDSFGCMSNQVDEQQSWLISVQLLFMLLFQWIWSSFRSTVIRKTITPWRILFFVNYVKLMYWVGKMHLLLTETHIFLFLQLLLFFFLGTCVHLHHTQHNKPDWKLLPSKYVFSLVEWRQFSRFAWAARKRCAECDCLNSK